MIIVRSNNLPAIFGTLKVLMNNTEIATFDKEAIGKEIALSKEQTYLLTFKQSFFTTQMEVHGDAIVVISAPPFFTTFYTLAIVCLIIPFLIQKYFLVIFPIVFLGYLFYYSTIGKDRFFSTKIWDK